MKTINDITSMEELKAIASDESVRVPDDLRQNISISLNALSFLDEDEPAGKRSAAVRISSIAASLALLVGIGIGIGHAASSPKDTFTDPHLAYAQLEEAFAMMSSKMDKGITMAQEAGNMINKTNEIMNKM